VLSHEKILEHTVPGHVTHRRHSEPDRLGGREQQNVK
jgi:hypothetical protein